MPLNNNNRNNIFCFVFFLSAKDFVSLDGFFGDISDDEVRHRKSSSHRGPPGRRKPEKVVNSEFYQWSAQLAFLGVLLSFIYGGVMSELWSHFLVHITK